ncbi:MAG TPA: alpha-amylase family glycosyl hydrolase [Terriglobales bacterium]|nr:alpha-amylase family glycosyl hydrolase [Terriglobales bacterium]
MFEFHVSRAARERYAFDDQLFSLHGNVVFANLAASREFAERMNRVRQADRHPERAVHAGALNAMGLIDESVHAMMAQYRRSNPGVMAEALAWLGARLGALAVDEMLLKFADHFPTVAVYRGKQTAAEWLAGTTEGTPNTHIALEEVLLLWLANANPAFQPFMELFDDDLLARGTAYNQVTGALPEFFDTQPRFGPQNQNLIAVLRAPAMASPDSLEGQLDFIRGQWTEYLGELFRKMLTALDILKEEKVAVWMRFHPPAQHFGPAQTWGDSSKTAIPQFTRTDHEYERFSPDRDWMPRTVMIAKSIYVWLHQLSVAYKRPVERLDQVPDEELDLLARRGFNGLWLIGVWERSKASQRIKQMCGNPEAAASAYSLYDYEIAQELGGDLAYENLRSRAWSRGIRLASDMVPNHMGIDSRWVIHHPDWFLSLPYSPYPAYSFEGPDVSQDERVEIKIEDHYFNRTDAAVVFRRRDRWTGDTRYIYHGNDGTSFPWNDTAQLNYLKPEVREGVIQTILHVARRFPIIRFDAAMTLAKRHYQRLWFPEPGSGGAIPSRAEHGMTKAEFDAAMPVEFWREVVDRVAREAPDTLLLAEAFWLMEGYFVRTLGMHRVYNSAFMNMLRDEENANYRNVIKNTITFDPEILKRYVNFMNNPDERTAVDQFGKGDKYFGVCTLLATLPGLPMFGHGQIEGFTERYGMEYRRAYHDEQPDNWLVARHERQITPLLHQRRVFADVRDFLLYDFFTEDGAVNEDVFAYSNRSGDERALVVFNNRYASTRGWIRVSAAYAEKTSDGGKHLRQRTLGEAFSMSRQDGIYAACHDSLSGLEHLFRARDLAERGLRLDLHAYHCHVFLDWRELQEDATHPWGELCDSLDGRGVPSLEDALHDLQLKPVHNALRELLSRDLADELARCAAEPDETRTEAALESVNARTEALLREVRRRIAGGGRLAELAKEESGEIQVSTEDLIAPVEMAVGLYSLSEHAGRDVSPGRILLPAHDVKDEQRPVAMWSAVLAWSAMEAITGLLDEPRNPAAVGQMFDELWLRGPIAEAFAAAGITSEERWRAAARLRAAFVHAAPTIAPYSWIHDPDVAWVIGVHQYEGSYYLVKEHFERLLWWMEFRRLLDVTDEKQLQSIEREVRAKMEVVARAGYRLEALEESMTREESDHRIIGTSGRRKS